MQLPALWVDSLFARLQVRYGAPWTSLWAGLDLAIVKADWADELGAFHDCPEAIKHALANLPADRPPNGAQFKLLCRRPTVTPPALPAPRVDPKVVEAVKKAFAPKSQPAKAWAHALRKREFMGDRLSITQRSMWRAALGIEPGQTAQPEAA